VRPTTNFDDFFEDVGELSVDERAHLQQAVALGRDLGRWKVSRRNDKTFVDGDECRLCIIDGAARKLFNRQLQERSDSPDIAPEDEAMRRKAMQTDD